MTEIPDLTAIDGALGAEAAEMLAALQDRARKGEVVEVLVCYREHDGTVDSEYTEMDTSELCELGVHALSTAQRALFDSGDDGEDES